MTQIPRVALVTGASRRGTANEGWSGLVMDVDDHASVPAPPDPGPRPPHGVGRPGWSAGLAMLPT